MMTILNRYNYLLCFFAVLLIFSCKTEPKSTAGNKTNTVPESLQLRLKTDPDALSPILARSGASRRVYRHLYTRLLEIDPISLEVIPQLASELPIEETLENGSRRFTFNIRPEAKWSNGEPLTANDILFSYKILKHPGVSTRYGVIADLVNDIQINPQDSSQISFTSADCHISLVSSIAEMYIYPEHIFDPKGVMRSIPFTDFLDKDKIMEIGKGSEELGNVSERFMDPNFMRDPNKFVTSSAYTFKEWITGQRIVLQKNKNWWGSNIDNPIFKQNAEEIQFQIIPDNNTAITQLVNGELDVLTSITSAEYLEHKEKENLTAHESPAQQIIWLNLNNEKGLLSSKLIRLALAHTCDKESIIKNALDGLAKPVTGPFMPGSVAYYEKAKSPELDFEKARSILKLDGWEDSDQDGIMDKIIDGKKTKLSLDFKFSNNSTLGPIIGELVKNNALKSGIEINLVAQDRKVNSQAVRNGDFDIHLSGTAFGTGLYDPKSRWHTESFPPNGSNYCRFGNSETDKIIDEIRTNCDDEAKRTNQYHRLHAIMNAEQPVIFLYNPQNLFLVNKKFDNIVVSACRPGFFEEFLTLK